MVFKIPMPMWNHPKGMPFPLRLPLIRTFSSIRLNKHSASEPYWFHKLDSPIMDMPDKMVRFGSMKVHNKWILVVMSICAQIRFVIETGLKKADVY